MLKFFQRIDIKQFIDNNSVLTYFDPQRNRTGELKNEKVNISDNYIT